MKVSKLSKVEQIRKELHDGYYKTKTKTNYTPFTKHFYRECTKYVDSTLARKYSHEQLDEALTAITNDLKSN